MSLLPFIGELDKDRTSLENVPSNLYESICMPDFDEFFQQGAGYPLPENKATQVLNGTTNNNNNGPTSSTSSVASASSSSLWM